MISNLNWLPELIKLGESFILEYSESENLFELTIYSDDSEDRFYLKRVYDLKFAVYLYKTRNGDIFCNLCKLSIAPLEDLRAHPTVGDICHRCSDIEFDKKGIKSL